MESAFVSSYGRSVTNPIRRRPCRHQRRRIWMASSDVLVVAELEAMGAVSPEMHDFFARVDTHRKAKQTCYLVLATQRSHKSAMKHMSESKYPLGVDCLVTRSGLDIYQMGYATPDPYYAELFSGNDSFDRKPTEWVMSEFFSEKLKPDRELQNEGSPSQEPMIYDPKETFGENLPAVQEEVSAKLTEMGLKSRVVVDLDAKKLQILPISATIKDAIGFIQKMTKITEENTMIFGAKNSVIMDDVAKQEKSLLILSGVETPDNADPRIFETASVGATALLEGLLHHAIL